MTLKCALRAWSRGAYCAPGRGCERGSVAAVGSSDSRLYQYNISFAEQPVPDLDVAWLPCARQLGKYR